MTVIEGKPRDLGDGFHVSRILPSVEQRAVGPFVFFDYFGPVRFAPGKGIDVRPHPHIGLATVTYLFEGAQMHRDTLGSVQEIQPGDVNWMTAGRGIAHSERTGPAMRAAGHRLHGIQSWIGLPTASEEAPPSFQHVASRDLPAAVLGGVTLKIVTGEAFGLKSPVRVFSPMFYADAQFAAGSSLVVTAEHEERAVFVVGGNIAIDGETHGDGTMIVLRGGEAVTLHAAAPARAMLLGGAALDGPRHLWWNFVSSSKERIERAKRDWQAGSFGTIPGDDKEFIPLPD
ncbi:MAG TPA: pirin family protein [Rhizomicrobium sp.]|jgi:redox-sensitive bicupin YhaK (pirin superfamily)|nr:pirin family protein [Rhizomicrobium sp.]